VSFSDIDYVRVMKAGPSSGYGRARSFEIDR
jgi:hypothetical protein